MHQTKDTAAGNTNNNNSAISLEKRKIVKLIRNFNLDSDGIQIVRFSAIQFSDYLLKLDIDHLCNDN